MIDIWCTLPIVVSCPSFEVLHKFEENHFWAVVFCPLERWYIYTYAILINPGSRQFFKHRGPRIHHLLYTVYSLETIFWLLCCMMLSSDL